MKDLWNSIRTGGLRGRGINLVNFFSILATAGAWFAAPDLQAATASDYAVQVSAQVQTSPPTITLSWPQDSGGAPTSYVVYRKALSATSWGTGTTLSGSTTSYSDTSVSVGTAYEYQIQKNASGHTGYGYIYAGVELPATDSRGKVVLIVDETFASDLATELTRLQEDLAGDGWTVLRHDVSRSATPSSVKALIQSDYNADPTNVKAVFLFGRVPVPYSGNITPDGHPPDHLGAWPADVYYADMDGTWTDSTVNSTGASLSRNRNVPGDGKFDQSTLPADVKLQVGRVDLSDLPAFNLSERELLRQYLNKNHNFRHKTFNVTRRGLVADNFGAFSGEAFASSGWRAFAPVFGASSITTVNSGQFISTLSSQGHLWAYGCGGGTYTSAGGVGSTSDFASSDPQAVFYMLFGSYFGDWDSQNNFLRAPLAAQTYGLASIWAGRPHSFLHPMALGETIGFGVRRSQNNIDLYNPVNYGSYQVHVALMGDPTLRLHPVAPPATPTVSVSGNTVTLNWSASGDSVLGYHVYRAASAAGPFSRVNGVRVSGTAFNDTSVASGEYVYQIRAEKLESASSGSYYNLSQGVFIPVVVDVQVNRTFPANRRDVVTVTTPDSTASETGSDPAAFVIALSEPASTDVSLNLEIGGTAANGEDYRFLPANVTIYAGRRSATLRVIPNPDALLETIETVSVKILSSGSDNVVIDPAASGASISITDNTPIRRIKSRRR